MNILMLAPLPPPSGGIASWTVRYKEYCEENRINLQIVNIAMKGERAISETMQYRLKVEFKRTWNIISDLKKKVRNSKPDVVHINTSCSHLGIFRDALCVLSIYNRVPIVMHCRCNIEDQLKGKIAPKLFEYLVKKASKVIVLNKFSSAYVERIEKGKSVFIPNFANGKMVAEKHVINDEIKNVIYVGHIERAKGIVQLAEAARLLPDIHFTLVGAIREDISDIDIPSNVLIVGRVGVEEVQRYLKEADVFLFPSKTEGFSNAVLEAMAMGLPIIASDVGANSAMIENQGGIILKENTGIAICQAICEISSSDVRGKMSAWNIDKVKTSYMVKKVMQEYFEIYRQVR